MARSTHVLMETGERDPSDEAAAQGSGMRAEAAGSAADVHVAVVSHNLEDLVRHAARGGDVDARVRGTTPLGSAVGREAWDTARLLLALGADVNRRSRDSVGREEPPLCLACRLGSVEGVSLLLGAPGIAVGRGDFFGKTAVWHAAKHRRPDLVRLLLCRDASAGCATSFADCPLWLCARYGGRQTIAALLLASGRRKLHADASGRDAVWWARSRNDAPLLAALGAAGPTGASPPSLQWLARRAFWTAREDGPPPRDGPCSLLPPRLRGYLAFADIVPPRSVARYAPARRSRGSGPSDGFCIYSFGRSDAKYSSRGTFPQSYPDLNRTPLT